MAHAAKAFFDEGGRKLYFGRVKAAGSSGKVTIKDWQNALNALAKLKDISVVAAPGSTEQGRLAGAIQSRLIAHAEAAKRIASSGFICGIYARSGLESGVFKAPANEVVRSAVGFERPVTKWEQETLNPAGVNCLRYFAGKGHRVWGARTASSDPEWKYVNVRRYLIYLEQCLDQGTRWAVFEPNAEPLWANVRRAVSDFLFNEWKHGGLLGRKPDEAFFVRCDRATMTQHDINVGRLICQVGVVPVKPAEFVSFRIGQLTGTRN